MTVVYHGMVTTPEKDQVSLWNARPEYITIFKMPKIGISKCQETNTCKLGGSQDVALEKEI